MAKFLILEVDETTSKVKSVFRSVIRREDEWESPQSSGTVWDNDDTTKHLLKHMPVPMTYIAGDCVIIGNTKYCW